LVTAASGNATTPPDPIESGPTTPPIESPAEYLMYPTVDTVLEYKDDAAHDLHAKTIAKVRATRRDKPAWKAIRDNEQNVHVGNAYSMANLLPPQ
jgi:alkyl sulfatase BDS1-like metallo-beta-lactamase superfamily hydrolase